MSSFNSLFQTVVLKSLFSKSDTYVSSGKVPALHFLPLNRPGYPVPCNFFVVENWAFEKTTTSPGLGKLGLCQQNRLLIRICCEP